MSIHTWKLEFYPVKSQRTRKPIDHSILKWSGLTKENLEKHGLKLSNSTLYDGEGLYFDIDGTTCALCFLVQNDSCEKCIVWAKNGRSCYKEYWKFMNTGDPQPMLDLLKGLK